MRKIILLAVLLVVINFAVFAFCDGLGVDDFLLYFFILPVAILVSVILFIIQVIKTIRKNYIAKDAVQRKASRRKGLLIFAGIVVVLAIGWVILCFQSGYTLPGRDEHKDWKYFPQGSNPAVAMVPVNNFYIKNIEPIKGSPYYAVHFATDSVKLHDGYLSFVIMDDKGKLKAEYKESVTAYADNIRIIVHPSIYGETKLPVTCDVYNNKTLALSKAEINAMPMPLSYKEFAPYYDNEKGQADFKAKYRSDFYDNLEGIAWLEPDPVYKNADNKERGYMLYKDADGKLYMLVDYDDNSQLSLLAPQCSGYTLKDTNYGNKTVAANIKQSAPSIIYENNLGGGFETSYGKPNGGRDGLFFNFYQTWLMYYTAQLGSVSTSFKLNGSAKDMPYIDFYQINRASASTDTLLFVAKDRLWQLYKK